MIARTELLLVAAGLALAGCLDTASPAGEPQLAVEVTAEPARIRVGEVARLEALARHTSGDPVAFRDGCSAAWEWRVRAPDGSDVAVVRASCAGYREATLAGGGATSDAFEWNGCDDARRERVPDGVYAVEADFDYYRGAFEEGPTSTARGRVEVEVRGVVQSLLPACGEPRA